jgi:uncharacterized membrane protein
MRATTTSYGSTSHDLRMTPLRWLLAGLAVLFLLVGVGVLVAVANPGTSYTYGMPWMMGGWYGGWMLGGLMVGMFVLFFLLLLWVVLVGVGSREYPSAVAPSDLPRSRDVAMDLARQRLARGEITHEQFSQIATDLERH